MTPEIGPYVRGPAAFLPYDPGAPAVARGLIALIAARNAMLRVHHVGSTAVPGCAGKGKLDLLVTYPEGRLEEAKRALAELGFQRQVSRDPFPEERPMRVGSVTRGGRSYGIHAHVVCETAPEVAELLRFRDRLRADGELRAAYETEKQRILAAGVADSIEYAIRKGEFVERVLAGLRAG